MLIQQDMNLIKTYSFYLKHYTTILSHNKVQGTMISDAKLEKCCTYKILKQESLHNNSRMMRKKV